jgi:hypothetical protein
MTKENGKGFALVDFLSDDEKQALSKINEGGGKESQPEKDAKGEGKTIQEKPIDKTETNKETNKGATPIGAFEIPDDFDETDKSKSEGKGEEKGEGEGEEKGVEEGEEKGEGNGEEKTEEGEETKQGKAFAAMRKEIKELKAALQTSKAMPEKEKEDYRKTIEELTNKLSRYSLLENPKFIETYEMPLRKIEGQITKLLKEFNIQNPESVATSLLNSNIKNRTEFLKENLPDISQTLLNLSLQYDSLQESRNEALNSHSELRKKYEEEITNQRNLEQIRLKQEMMQSGLNELMEEGQFILTPKEGNEQWNKIMAATMQRIKYLFETNDVKEQAKALILASAAPVYLKMFQIERAKRKELENKFGMIKKSNKMGKQTMPTEKPGKPDAKKIIEETFNKYMKST